MSFYFIHPHTNIHAKIIYKNILKWKKETESEMRKSEFDSEFHSYWLRSLLQANYILSLRFLNYEWIRCKYIGTNHAFVSI